MRNFWTLFKVDIINSYRLNALKKKFSDKGVFLRVLLPVLAVIFALFIFVSTGFYIYGFGTIFNMANDSSLILLFGIAVSSLICLFTTISRANNILFESKDYDMLMSLPIQTEVIIVEKLVNLVIINYLSFILFYLPTVVVYGIFEQPSILFYIIALVFLLIGPLLIVTICSVISFAIAKLLAKLKYKNIIKIIGMIVFLVLVMSFSMFSGMAEDIVDNPDELTSFVLQFRNTLTKVFYIGTWAENALLGNIVDFLKYVGISVIPFIIFVVIVSKNFVKANSASRVTYTVKNFKLLDQKISSPTMALFKKELKRYFSSPLVVMNTISGPLISTIFTVMFIFGEGFITTSGSTDTSTKLMIILLISLFTNSLITTSASLISLEGKNLWIIKSAPLSETSIFISKILMSSILAVPFIIINSILAMIFVEFNVIAFIGLLLVPMLMNIFMSVVGLYINLLYPKFDWQNEAQVVKQSMSIGIATFVGMLFGGGMIVLSIVFSSFGLMFMYIALAIVILILLGLSVLLLLKDGVKRYRKIKA